MTITLQDPQSGDETGYTPDWIKMDIGGLSWDDELVTLGDDDLYPELDPEESPDYINHEKMRR